MVLEENGLTRRVAVQVPTFLLLPHMLIGMQRIASLPIGMAAELARMHPLRIVKSPLQIPGFTMSQGWHEIHRNDAGHRWLRELFGSESTKPRLRPAYRASGTEEFNEALLDFLGAPFQLL